MAKTGHFFSVRHPTPRRRLLRLGGTEPRISTFSGPPRHREAPPRHSEALPKRTCKPCFGSYFPLIMTTTHWINEDPNKQMKGFVPV